MNFEEPSDRVLPVLTPQVPSASSVSTVSTSSDALQKPSWLTRLKALSEKGPLGTVSIVSVSIQPEHKPRPSIDERGVLIIPHESDEKYHWWADGQSIAMTLEELHAPPEVLARYLSHNNP